MYVVTGYPLAVALCVVTMLCWGSWANTQKATGRWRFELFYWDYVFGVMLMSVVFAFTLGSFGAAGQGFLSNLRQAGGGNLGSAILAGVVFNAANILLVATIDSLGMAVAFPVGIGIALLVGVLENYVAKPNDYNPIALFGGVALIVLAIILDALAYRRLSSGQTKGVSTRGLALCVACGLLMGSFYWLVARTMSKETHVIEPGKLTPYCAVFLFCVGVLASNLIFNTLMMKKPLSGPPLSWADYGRGSARQHVMGLLGGGIWCVGMTMNIIAGGTAGFAISYGLGQGATMIAAAWGVFVWREFRAAPRGTNIILAAMFVFFLVGLTFVIAAKS